jgi:anoctamin-10
VALWSIAWPLVPLACVVNNWIEVRSDAVKLCTSRRRPIPQRADSIGPWSDNISFLSWLGTLTSSTLIYLFGEEDAAFLFDYKAIVTLLVIVLVVEHGYWAVDGIVGRLSHRMKTPGEVNVMREEYILRKKYFGDIKGTGSPLFEDSLSQQCVGIPHDFWKEKNIERLVSDSREMLATSWKKRVTK